MAKAYHIVHWDSLYETHESRKIRTLAFYSKPNKLVGEGIGLTLQEPDNVALLGTWALLEALASTSAREQRGWLIRNGTALTAARMAALVRVEVHHFERALEWFSRPEIGWLEEVETDLISGDSPGNPAGGGKTPGDSPGNPAQEERGREKEVGRKIRERGETLSQPAARDSAPSEEEVKEWAAAAEVPEAYALELLTAHSERGDFRKSYVRDHWRIRFARFWKADAEAWRKKNKKTAAPQTGGRPDGWKEGDAECWWTDDLLTVRGAMAGAAHSDKKTAARIAEIIKAREARK